MSGAQSYADEQQYGDNMRQGGNGGALGKNRRFADAYEQSPQHGQAGSSGAARKVMDFFRRTGKGREGRR
ncbi:MAG: hypothetical protein M1820_010237 [Bogoriella megaspora]|nr:MAG: hypothetical protein M1820_010237 [Bogoriella megaspora]